MLLQSFAERLLFSSSEPRLSRDACFVDKPFPATAQDRESMSSLRTRIGDSSNNMIEYQCKVDIHRWDS